MTSLSPSTKNLGITRAQAAITGILLIAATWLILHTINPHLLDFHLTPCPGGQASCTVNNTAGGTTPSGASGASTAPLDNAVKDAGYAASVDDLVGKMDSTPPSAAACGAVDVSLGLNSPDSVGLVKNVGNAITAGGNTTYYILKAGLVDTFSWDNIWTGGPTPSQVLQAGTAAYNN